MRNTREILRQKWLLKRPHRAVVASVGVSMGTVSLALARASAAELTWEAVQALDDAQLEAALYPSVVAAASRPEPDCTWNVVAECGQPHPAVASGSIVFSVTHRRLTSGERVDADPGT